MPSQVVVDHEDQSTVAFRIHGVHGALGPGAATSRTNVPGRGVGPSPRPDDGDGAVRPRQPMWNSVPLLMDGRNRADSRPERSREVEWHRIRADIDAGRLAMVGLVRHTGISPFHLTQSHQVLAYAYQVAGDAVTLRIYDPNWPGRDDVSVHIQEEAVGASTGEIVHGALRLA
jgi:hypothetical protein